MAYYRLYFLSPRTHGIMRFEEFDAASDELAVSKSRAHEGYCALELWSGGRRVAWIEAAPASSGAVQRVRPEAVAASYPVVGRDSFIA